MLRKVLGVLACFAICQSAHATLFLDLGKSTVDTQSQLEWLDLNESYGYSYNQVKSGSISKLAGWRYATLGEVQALYSHFGFAIEEHVYFEGSPWPIDAFNLAYSLLGNSYASTSEPLVVEAIIDQRAGSFLPRIGAELLTLSPSPGGPTTPTKELYVDLIAPGTGGVGVGTGCACSSHFLVRDYVSAVPEPGTLALVGIGLAGISSLRRRRAAA